jgi:uncharacterized protein (DUF2141 family)
VRSYPVEVDGREINILLDRIPGRRRVESISTGQKTGILRAVEELWQPMQGGKFVDSLPADRYFYTVMKQFVRKIAVVAIFGYIFGCATEGFPPGGPEDKTPPVVLRTVPEQGTLNVPRNVRVEFHFSEKIDSRSVARAVFISPNPGERVKIKTKGKRLIIEFQDSLIANVTYTITLGTEIRDMRNNRLPESYTLAFSTGDQLDRNEIEGRVYAEKPEEVTVWAYFLPDTGGVNPWRNEPHYITQCDARGKFHFTNLARRRYRLFAVRDRNKNRRLDPRLDEVGVTFGDVDLRGERVAIGNRFFRLMPADTGAVQVLDSQQPDRYHLQLRFSRPIHRVGFVQLRDQTGGEVPVHSFTAGLRNAEIWTAVTAPRDSAEMVLKLAEIVDIYGHLCSDTLIYRFESTARADTSHPVLLEVMPPDSSRLLLPEREIRFAFSEAVDTSAAVIPPVLTADSLAEVPIRTWWNGTDQLIIRPVSSWPLDRWLRMDTAGFVIRDIAGNELRLSDSLFMWKTVRPETLSAISGTISVADSAAKGRVYLSLFHLETNATVAQQVLEKPGGYVFSQVLPGRYVLHAFLDRDGNSIFSHGRVLPFVPSELFLVAPDTILVRARWPNEGNNYRFPHP